MSTHRRNTLPSLFASLAAVLALAAAGCGGAADPVLQAVSIDSAQVYATVGVPQRLTASGQYSDGTVAALTEDLTWSSSDEAVATVDAHGVVTPWTAGSARITATHASGLSATADVTSRVIVALRASTGLPATSRVDTATTFFRISGLVPGAMYETTVANMSDDVDVGVYSDASLAPAAELCWSGRVGIKPERCTAPANASGELWVAIDGQWTRGGADFSLSVAEEARSEPVATLAYPDYLPFFGAIGVTRQVYEIKGLDPAAKYQIAISNLSADIDVGVYGDDFLYALLCESYETGTADDLCIATPNAAGRLFVEIDGETTRDGGTYTLAVTKK